MWYSQLMKKVLIALLLICTQVFSSDLKEELNIHTLPSDHPNVCTIYLVHHGSTDWSEIGRLQGWNHVPLNEKGRQQSEQTALRLSETPISAIYTSPLLQAKETAEILQTALHGAIFEEERLKGEFHGAFEGYTVEQYSKEPHFQIYDRLSPQEELFFPCGLGGESKAEMAKRMIPAIQEIARAHLGENIVIVTHGGIFKVFNYFLGRYAEELTSIPNGSVFVIQADQNQIYLSPF